MTRAIEAGHIRVAFRGPMWRPVLFSRLSRIGFFSSYGRTSSWTQTPISTGRDQSSKPTMPWEAVH